jgi:hypothetical protein
MTRRCAPAAQILATFLLAATCIAGPAAAQQTTGSISGVVTNAATKRPLAGVQVYIPGTRLGTLSTATGQYVMPNVPAGDVTVVAEMIGFSRTSQTVRVSAGANGLLRWVKSW